MDKKAIIGFVLGFLLGSLVLGYINYKNVKLQDKQQDTHQEDFLNASPKMGQ